MNKRNSRTKRAGRAVAWGVAKRLLQRAPVVGTALTIGLAGYDIKRKGIVKGAVNIGWSRETRTAFMPASQPVAMDST